MGKVQRLKPARLPEKLRQIREGLGLSQNQMVKRLGFSAELVQSSISGFELGTREPALPVLLKYAEAAGICTDILINDDLDLPDKLPSKAEHKPSIKKQ